MKSTEHTVDISWPIRLNKPNAFELGPLQETPGKPSVQIRLRLRIVLELGRLRFRTDERRFARNQPPSFRHIWVLFGSTWNGDEPWRIEEVALVVVDSGVVDGPEVVHLCFRGAVRDDTEVPEHLFI